MQSASDTPSSHLREPSRRADRRGVRRGGARRANPGTIRLSPFPESLAAGSRQVSRGIMRHSCGAILGALVLTFLPELLVVFEDYEVMIFGAILMTMMIFMPQGLFGGLQDLVRRLRRSAASSDPEARRGTA